MGNETVRVIRKHPSCAAPQSMLKQAKGFTLIELMLAVSIVGVLASLAVPNYLDFVEKARVAKTISELYGLTKEIKGYALGAQQYPNSLADIGRSTMLDPWGTPYQYYKINCGTINDIGSLARLKLRKKDSPRVIPAADSPFTHSNGHISLAVDNGDHQHLLHFVQGAGGGNGGGGNGGGGGGNGGGGGGPPCGGVGGARKDRFLVPINSDFDIYSMGKDKDTVAPLNPPKSHDDIIRAS
ncbi:MAG: type II secretion system GspH family protein, partial [Nitrospira sp.]|nr:type II secretion system GspH family protein [Nitrospira sp.]